MYKIIGADEREYGPVPLEQVRKWIAERRADAQTKGRSEGGSEWKTLGEFPELADVLTPIVGDPQGSPPKIGLADAERLAGEIIARDYRLDVGDCFSRSWHLVRDNFLLLAGATALTLAIGGVLWFVPALGIPGAAFLALVFQGGLQWLFLKRVRGEPADIGDVFAGFSLAFVPLLLAGIVVHVLVGIGLLLCIVPGVYLFVAWRLFVPLLILDKKLEFWPAMELSRRVVTRHWWLYFGLILLAIVVGLLGALGCFVGILFTLPIAVGATVYAYLDVFGAEPEIDELLAPSSPGPASSPASPTEPSGTPPEATPAVSAAAVENSTSSAPAPESGPVDVSLPESVSPSAPPPSPPQSWPENPG